MYARAGLTLLAPLGVLVALVGCTDESASLPPLEPDAATSFDASSPSFDASMPDTDARAPLDSTVPFDGTVTPDSAVPVDSSMPVDVVIAKESSTEKDASVVDAPAEAEGADASDGGAPFDAGSADAADAASGDAGDATTAGGIALQFDGVQDLVILPAADGGANENAFTAEVWFNTTNPTGTMFEVYAGGAADRFVFLQLGEVCFYVFGTPITTVCSPSAGYDDGAWHHAAGTLGATSGTSIYVDGVLAASSATPTTSNFNYDTTFRLGYGHTALNSTLVYFGGTLDEVRVWSVERTAAEILASYRTHLPGTTPGLQGYWKLDGSGTLTIAADSTPNGNDGTLTSFTFKTSPWVTPGAF